MAQPSPDWKTGVTCSPLALLLHLTSLFLPGPIKLDGGRASKVTQQTKLIRQVQGPVFDASTIWQAEPAPWCSEPERSNPVLSLGVVVYTCNPSAGEAEDRRISISMSCVVRPCTKCIFKKDKIGQGNGEEFTKGGKNILLS